MTLKRLLMPVLMLGISLTMGSMAFAQITCGINASGPAIAAAALNTSTVAGNSQPLALQGPSANATATGHTEPIAAGPFEVPQDTTPGPGNIPPGAGTVANRVPGGGTIRVTCVNGPVAQAPGVIVLTLTVGAPITNTQQFPTAAAGIRVINGTGVFITAGPTGAGGAPTNGGGAANVGISSVNNAAGQVVIGLGTPTATSGPVPAAVNPTAGIAWAAGATGTFDIAGILVSTNGLSGGVAATLATSPGMTTGAVAANANANASSQTATVVTAVTPGIVDPTLVASGTLPGAVTAACVVVGGCTSGPAVLLSSGAAFKNNFTIKIQENYAEFFKSAAQFNGGATFPAGTASSVQLNVVLNNVPAGLAITNCSAAITDTTGTVAKSGAPTVTANNSISNTLNVLFGADTDLTAVDVVYVSCQVGIGTATLPLPSTPITAQVSIAPVGTALSSTSTAQTGLTTGNIPRYQQKLQPATGIPVVNFPPTQTTLLIPFAVVAPGINTGIAVANTSTDIFGTANGGASPTAGTIVFTMYPQAGGTPLTATTASVAAGSLYANNLSGILPTGTTTFTGYIFATANFPNAHGSATIYDTSTGHAELSTPVLVVIGAAGGNVTSASTRPTPESLGQ